MEAITVHNDLCGEVVEGRMNERGMRVSIAIFGGLTLTDVSFRDLHLAVHSEKTCPFSPSPP